MTVIAYLKVSLLDHLKVCNMSGQDPRRECPTVSVVPMMADKISENL